MNRRAWSSARAARGLVAIAAVTVFSLAYAREVNARCAMSYWVPTVLSRGPIARDGSIVLGLLNSRSAEYTWLNTEAAQQIQQGNPPVGLSLRRGNNALALRTERIAPGLYRLTPHSAPSTGAWTVAGLPTAATVNFAANPAVTLTAPAVRSARLLESQVVLGRGGPSTHRSLQVELSARVPEGAVAVTVTVGTARTPSFFSVIPAGVGLSLSLYETPGRCSTELPGGSPPTAAAPVSLAWVDASGRVSPASFPVQMTVSTAP